MSVCEETRTPPSGTAGAIPGAGEASGPPTLLFAVAAGVLIVNLFAPQTLIALIAPELGLSEAQAGLVSMMTLAGYSLGLFFLVPLADRFENRALILRTLMLTAAAAAAAALAPGAGSFLIATLVLGIVTSVIQMLVPMAAAMAPAERRGQVVGDVMSGLMVGILLARPVASLVADQVGWRWCYGATVIFTLALAAVLARRLPVRRPSSIHSYPALIGSLGQLLLAEPVLRRRALTAALMMGAFSAIWTTVALRLGGEPFGLGPTGVALFALLGAGGAVAAPLAGRAGDRGWTRPMLRLAHLGVIASLALAAMAGEGLLLPEGTPVLVRLGLLALAGFLLDLFATFDQTLGRRAVNLLNPEARGRLNGLFVGIFFLGGASGSALSGLAWASGGWPAVCAVAAAFGLAALLSDPLLDRIGALRHRRRVPLV